MSYPKPRSAPAPVSLALPKPETIQGRSLVDAPLVYLLPEFLVFDEHRYPVVKRKLNGPANGVPNLLRRGIGPNVDSRRRWR